jgi:ABC-type sugar transport system substrate-binding protein
MGKHMKNLLTKSAGVALCSLSLMLLVTAADAGATGKKVAYFDAGPSHPYVVALNKAFNARAKDRGLEVTQFDTPYDAALQSQQIDDAIARKFDLLAIMAASQSAIVPALNRAKKAGIPVIILNNGIKDGVEDLYVANVIDDNAKLGRLAADATLRALKEGGRDQAKVALITGVLAEGVAKTRLDAYSAALKDHPEVKIVATEDAYWDTAKSEMIAGQLFARFAPQGGLDVAIGWADNQTAAIIRAAEAAHIPLGTEKGKLIVLGMNCNRDGIQAIKDGREYSTATQPPVRMGEKTADVVADYFDGKTPPKQVVLDVEAIDRNNIDKFAAGCTY